MLESGTYIFLYRKYYKYVDYTWGWNSEVGCPDRPSRSKSEDSEGGFTVFLYFTRPPLPPRYGINVEGDSETKNGYVSTFVSLYSCSSVQVSNCLRHLLLSHTLTLPSRESRVDSVQTSILGSLCMGKTWDQRYTDGKQGTGTILG